MTTLAEKRQAREVATAQTDQASMIEQVLIKGDLGKLTPEQRDAYYLRVCEVTGLNPLTQPFSYLTLNNKLVLYANKACTDQLRALHDVSVIDMDEEVRADVFIVTVKVQNGKGRTDMGKGAVSIAGLQKENLANAIMKAETKAKRRATLSICGLGLLDETEVETIQGATTEPGSSQRRTNVVVNPNTGKKIDLENANNQRKNGSWDRFTDQVASFVANQDADGLKEWFASGEIAEYVAGWVFKDQAHEHVERALEVIADA